MCGIAGFVLPGSEDPGPRLDRMLASMAARGPDGEGRHVGDGVALGMRRLAVLDVAHGQQPFTSEDGRIVAFANGEIYNHRELRKDLEARGVRFRTRCDAEVLPDAFRVFGAEAFASRLDGMFAIAILDRQTRRLHLYRDRYGEKPVFYSEASGAFRFASQLTTLAAEPDQPFEIDEVALRHYLALHYVPGPRTIVRDVRRLPPGHHLVLDLERSAPPVIRRWATDVEDTAAPRSYGGAVRQVRARLEQAVSSRMLSDVPLGVFLSGGLDSSAIAAAAVRQDARVETFSVGFPDAELDESRFARQVAAALGTRHHHFEFDLGACLSVFDEAIVALDEPVGDPACLPVHLLSREARRHVKVVLAGEGADELFAGYDYYPEPAPPVRLAGRLRGAFRRRAQAGSDGAPGPFFRSDHTTPSGFPLLTTREERDRLVPGASEDEDAWSGALARRLARIGCPLERSQAADLGSWLPDDLLVKLDRMTMAASLEGRAPYLAPELASLALSLPAEWKRSEGIRKRVLRDAAAPWLPTEIAERRKQGFVLPMQRWLVGPLRERLLDGLVGESEDGLDLRAARRIALDDLGRGAARSRLLYGLLAYREWVAGVRAARARSHGRVEAQGSGSA